MIPLTVDPKTVIIDIFKEHIQLVKKHFMAISFDFDDNFRYDVFRDFISSAAGMCKEIDMGIYNKQLVSQYQTIQILDKRFKEFKRKSQFANQVYEKDFLMAQDGYREELKRQESLKAALQVLITKEKNLFTLKQSLEANFAKLDRKKDKERREKMETRLKAVRKEHVDTLHILGEHRNDLDGIELVLKEFVNKHKAAFMSLFTEVTEKLEYQYNQSLNYYGYEFNRTLFINSEQSEPIQKFKKDANIVGEFNLCKYVEYYVRNVNPDMLAEGEHKERVRLAKQYCKNLRERENLF